MNERNVEVEVKGKSGSEETVEDFVRKMAEETGQDYNDLFEAVKQAAKRFSDIGDSFTGALVAEIVESRRTKETKKDWKFVGFHIPESLLNNLDDRRMADGRMSRSEYVRNAVKIYLRMSGLAGAELRRQLDLILDEAMADRLGIAVQAALLSLGPEVSEKLISTVLVGVYRGIAESVNVEPERVQEKIMGALEELRLEGAVAAHQKTSQQAEITDANSDG